MKKLVLIIGILCLMLAVVLIGYIGFFNDNSSNRNDDTVDDGDNGDMGNDESKFYGTWNGTALATMDRTINISYTFNEDGTYSSTYEYGFFWEVKNNKLYAPVSTGFGFGYKFSNGDTHLTIYQEGILYMTLDKIE